MNVRHAAAITLVASVTATAVTALAQQSTEPSNHRHKLRRVPPLAHPPLDGNAAEFGAPLIGLSAEQLAAFAAGREEFESIETVEGGLGPLFNNTSCATCHSAPVSGGAGTLAVTRFGRFANGHFDPLADKGGSLLQQFATATALQEIVPPEANIVAQRITTPLFGAGLLEAIPDTEIELNARRNRPDGVSGRAAIITDVATGQQRIGRLGWKAQHASLLGFAADAYLNEMGVTNRFFPDENAPNGDQALLAQYLTPTGVDDPVDATGRSDIDAAADFIRLLAPPPAVRPSGSALDGQRLFNQINCDACHRPTMTTGASPIAALAHKVVPLYSDLLLHDMGSLGDGIEQGAAGAQEIKTAPLWGLRARPRLLHDGRATTIADAILAHAGEATPARDRFAALDDASRQQLIDFLNTL
jgi:CxxC motif-containing protein (DUF1111 family)